MARIISFQQLRPILARRKKEGKIIGFCNGNYDLLHPGHAMHFESAKRLCDVLVVAIASDKQVRRQKGIGRPVFTEHMRAYMLSQLRPVDFVFINDANNGSRFIRALKPDLYVRGPDYRGIPPNKDFAEEIQSAQKVGCRITFTKDKKLSTRDIITAIKKNSTYRR